MANSVIIIQILPKILSLYLFYVKLQLPQPQTHRHTHTHTNTHRRHLLLYRCHSIINNKKTTRTN